LADAARLKEQTAIPNPSSLRRSLMPRTRYGIAASFVLLLAGEMEASGSA
jgi:hypothetical protein